MSPTIGRVVHFFDHTRPRDASGKPGPFAAIVTAAPEPDDHALHVSLTVFPVGYPPFSVSRVPFVDHAKMTGQPVMRPTEAYWARPPRDAS